MKFIVLAVISFVANFQMIPSPQIIPTPAPTMQASNVPASSKGMVGKAYNFASEQAGKITKPVGRIFKRK